MPSIETQVDWQLFEMWPNRLRARRIRSVFLLRHSSTNRLINWTKTSFLFKVCTRDEKQLIVSGTAEGQQLEQQLLSRPARDGETHNAFAATQQGSQVSLNDIAQAVAFKNRLIEFDRTR
jgi:hypothetical protein